jgi:hypothetical protein
MLHVKRGKKAAEKVKSDNTKKEVRGVGSRDAHTQTATGMTAAWK